MQPWCQQGPSHARQVGADEEEEQQKIWAICDNCTPKEWAKGWLTNIANEDDDIKNHVLQQIMGM